MRSYIKRSNNQILHISIPIKFINFGILILIIVPSNLPMHSNHQKYHPDHQNILYYNPESTADFIQSLTQQLSDIDSLIKRSKHMINSHQCIYRYQQQIGPQNNQRKTNYEIERAQARNNRYNQTTSSESINFNISCTVSMSDQPFSLSRSSGQKYKSGNNRQEKHVSDNMETPASKIGAFQDKDKFYHTSIQNTNVSNAKDPIYFKNSTLQQSKLKPTINSPKGPLTISSFDQSSLIQGRNIKIEDQNTCQKNQLQNILRIQKQKIKRRNISELEIDDDDLNLSNHCKTSSVSPSNGKWKRKQEKSTYRSPSRHSKSPKAKVATPKSIPMSPKSPNAKNVKYIDKYINRINLEKKQKSRNNVHAETLSPGNSKKKNSTNSNIVHNMNARANQKYSHPFKESKSPEIMELKHLLETPKNTNSFSRQQFMEIMKKQCYVKRFLTDSELGQIYMQFCHRGIARVKWQQKIIEKIFNKIHQTNDIL